MKIYDKLINRISETKYLNAENSYRYRPIMRVFYNHYIKLEYWLYKEDIYNELKDNAIFSEYTLDDCERDLDILTEWLSLTRLQDTKNALSLPEFKNKKFRYQMTEYATEIERLVISLEELEIKASSLEPKLFDRLKDTIAKLENTISLSPDEVNEIWNDLNDNFTKLNESYQDFLKKFNEPKTEELFQGEAFLKYKTEIISYLRNFIQSYQQNINKIKYSINKIDEEIKLDFINKLVRYNEQNPLLNQNFDFGYFKELNFDKLTNILKWFVSNDSTLSEGQKLMDTTDNIIVSLTKYANSLIELRGNMTSRKEEYKHLCQQFDKISNMDEAHRLAAVILGISNVRHFLGNSNITTDTIVNTYDNPPLEIILSSRTKKRKEKIDLKPIEDKTLAKRKILEEYRLEQEKNKEILKSLIKNKKIILENERQLTKIERRYIQKLLASSLTHKETEFGLSYKIKKKEGTCKIVSEDGIFYMPSLDIEFMGDI